jgi:subtilisin family serine protease
MAKDEAVANAIRYAALHAHVLSMSWGGGENPDVRRAIDDAGEARYGLGAVCLAASGNDGDRTAIDRPARYPGVIAVGASTDQRRIASYSNRGRQLSVVAPSGGGIRDIYTSDVTMPGRGYNPGAPPAGLETGMFSGTSSATPLAAGIAALVLAVNGRLHRDEVKKILEQSAVKVGRSYNTRGRSNAWGHGRVSASAAVELAAAWT